MSKPSESKNRNLPRSGESDHLTDEPHWQPTTDILKNTMGALSSLRLTVALLGMSVFIVLAGTLGQVHRDIWEVIHDYFRMNLSEDFSVLASFDFMGRHFVIPTPVTWIDLNIFFPPAFSEGHVPPDLSKMFAPARAISSLVLGMLCSSVVWLFPMRDKKLQWGIFAAWAVTLSLVFAKMGGFWFPKGWTIGAVMAVNLLAAHLVRFKVQAKGARLWGGFGVIALGILVTMAVISSDSNKIDSNIKQLQISGSPTGGTYTLTVDYPFSRSYTEEFAYDATSADIQEKLRKHEGLENLVVTTEEGSPPNATYQFVFDKDAEELPNLNVDIKQLTGGSPVKTVKSIQDWTKAWFLFECVLAILLVLNGYGYVSLWRRTLRNPDLTTSERSKTVTMRRVAGIGTLLLAGLFFYLVLGGEDVQLNPSGMRILWQLLKATFAGLILLGGCMLVFRKRGGVVVLHGGVALIMLSELLVGVAAVETQMQIVEGQTANYVQDIREVEIAVTDPNDPKVDRVVTIPKRFLKEGALIQDERLPVNIRVDLSYKHSKEIRIKPGEENRVDEDAPFWSRLRQEWQAFAKNPATEGIGLVLRAEPAQGSTGTDNADKVDIASAYVTLFSKTDSGENDRKLGTWLITQYYPREQQFEVDGKTYDLILRHKRTYKPYTIGLNKVEQKNYVGTATPRDYRSVVHLKDPSRSEDRQNIHIWMNNPLRYAGETFYQSGVHDLNDDGDPDMTILSVVTNDGWMIPYVACMIVAVGMLAHFLITLSRFLSRDNRIGSQSTIAPSDDGNSEGSEIEVVEPGAPLMAKSKKPRVQKEDLDPLQKPAKWPWLTPALSIGLVLVFGGYLLSKARPPKPTKEGFDLYRAGQIPVTYEGRVKPLDTLARNSLRILSNRQEFTDEDGNKQPALRWLFDLIAKPEEADKHRVFRIDYQPLREDTLGLEKREGYMYSYAEIKRKREELARQLSLAREVDSRERSTYQKKVLELVRRIELKNNLEAAFGHLDIGGSDAFLQMMKAKQGEDELDKILHDNHVFLPLLASQVTDDWERYGKISLRQQVGKIAKQYKASSPQELSDALFQEYKRSLASNVVEQVRQEIRLLADQKHQTFAKTAEQQAETQTDVTLKQVCVALAESRPRDTNLDIVNQLPDSAFQDLAKQGAALLLQGLNLGGESPSGALALARLKMLAFQATNLVLDGESLEKFQNELPYDKVFAAYKKGKAEDFNQAVADFQSKLADDLPEDHEEPIRLAKLRFESFFNNAAPFYYLAVIYLIAGILAAISWLTCFQPLNRATFWLLTFCLVFHTAALIGRIYISGRPPVTNLYSSAVFIGWGCVLLGLLFEWFYDIGIGNLVAAVAGFMTLGVAHLLTTEVASFRGDSFTVLQAVLDTQFWLATHVVCISLGYAATFVAGFLGIAYILGGVFTPLLTEPRRKDLVRMIYGTLCFAIFFSFVGTVLGGLWADDSWGRFWGWDTKENGALIIVLWNALVLHARWGGIVKNKGLAAFAVAGNIAVSWSWFGVNELGIGLHSYGFTEGVLPVLAMFCISQVILVAIGCLPKDFWWSHIAEQDKKPA